MAAKISLKPISPQLIDDRMKFENPWWITQTIDDYYGSMKRRHYFTLFQPLVTQENLRRAIVLIGPRRVGKTVLMHHSIDNLIKTGVSSQKICFISIDNPIYLHQSLEDLFSIARNAVNDNSAAGWYVYFDEIQYLKNWEVHLKVLVDSFPQTKFIVSGSAAAALKFKSKESGAGRFTEFMLSALTFYEYIQLKGHSEMMRESTLEWKGNLPRFYSCINLQELNKHFIDYINFGGYPEVIFNDSIKANPGRHIKSDIVDKVLLRDLPSIYGIRDVQELNAFFTTLAYYSGNEVSLDTLSKNSGVEKNLLKKYLEYLQAAFLIHVVNRVDDTAKRFQRATFYKIFLTNPSLRSALFSPLELMDENIGSMVETAIYAQWMHQSWVKPWYARWSVGKFQGEVDMIGLDKKSLKPAWAIEIKWSNRYFEKTNELKSLVQFCQKNNLETALVTTLNKEGVKKVGDLTLYYVPAALLAYSIGAYSVSDNQEYL